MNAAATTPFASANGGAFALRTNSGRQSANAFAVIPELNLKLRRQFTERLSGFIGYSVLYASSVVRPGDQIDRTVNIGHAPSSIGFNAFQNPLRPAPVFERTDFWAHGLNFGLELRF